MLRSKLDYKKFPCLTDFEEIKKYITWNSNVDIYLIDPVFLGRYAHMCKDLGIIGNINSGTREPSRQIQLYVAVGGYQLKDGTWTGGKNTVAIPGRSWHEWKLALDTDTIKIKNINKIEATKDQTILMKYGLFKPLTEGNKTSIQEDWHIQPIETLGVKDKASLMPEGETVAFPCVRKGDVGKFVKKLQELLIKKGYSLSADGSFGELTEKAVIDFQTKNKLTVDGVAGKGTFEKLV